MRRAIIIVAAVVVLGAAEGWAGLVPVNAASVIRNGIEYYIETDKIVYDLGEDVEFVYRITNLTDDEWDVRWLGRGSDVVVKAKEEDFREVWAWSWGKGGDAGPRRLRLQAGESIEFLDIWPQVDYRGTWDLDDDMPVRAGTYGVTGSFRPTGVSVAVDITIIPEPGTVFLLAVGALGLLRRRTPTCFSGTR